jgi:hypothetical protein
MAAHFAGERGIGLFHFRFDQRVACLPHHRGAAMILDIVKKILRAFHLGDYRRSGICLKYRSREQDHQLIAPDYATVLIHNPDAIAIAIKRETDVSAIFFNRPDRVLEILCDRRIGMMIRKV